MCCNIKWNRVLISDASKKRAAIYEKKSCDSRPTRDHSGMLQNVVRYQNATQNTMHCRSIKKYSIQRILINFFQQPTFSQLSLGINANAIVKDFGFGLEI